jgi:hypothetical protein
LIYFQKNPYLIGQSHYAERLRGTREELMLKARLLLGALMIALVAGAYQIFEHPTMGVVDKNWIYIVDGLLFLSAGILMTVNLFSLDEDGRIPYGSVPYRFLHYWNNGKVPNELKLCPMFWTIFAMLTGTLVAVTMGSVFCYLVLAIIATALKTLITNPTVIFTGIGWVTLTIASVASVWFITSQILKLLGIGQSGVWSGLLLTLSSLLFLFGSAIAKSGTTLTAALVVTAKFLTGLTVVLGLLFVTILALVYLFSWLFPALKNSFLGQLVVALLGKLCPVIKVETEPKPVEEPYIDHLLFV